MNIIQCNICKKPFQSFGRRICADCLEKIDKDFIVVRDFIYEHKKADMDTVSEETGVSKQIIKHLLKEGRLTMDEPGSAGLLMCEVCRKPINSGRMCETCKGKVASTMNKNIVSHKQAEPQKREASQDTRSLGAAKISNR